MDRSLYFKVAYPISERIVVCVVSFVHLCMQGHMTLYLLPFYLVHSHTRITVDSISDITNNVRLGFGSFDDKPVRPYTYEGLT